MNSFHLVHLMFFLSFTQFLVVAHGCYDNERNALLEFKSLLHDPSNLLSSWQEGHIHQSCCNWHGVECSNKSFHVISINLREFSLTGKISPFLFNLTYLEYLDLSSNNFQGFPMPIPHQFNNLKKLAYLNISYSPFSGSITTQFNNLSSLRYLDLSGLYMLKASSLDWVRGLHNLESLKLSGVDLSKSLSSSSKTNFAEPLSYNSNLRVLDLSYCRIESSVFPEFHNHSRLSYLNLNGYSSYKFQPTFPVQLVNLPSLSFLYLSSCNLQGSIPYLPRLKELDVSMNDDLRLDLSRMFERQWPKLEKLEIANTKVMGPIPSSISNAPLLVDFDASACSLQGSLPSSICDLSSLRYLDLGGNNLTGTLPACIAKLRNLGYLDITANSIGGNVSLFSLINELNLTVIDLSPPNKPTVVIDDEVQNHLSKFKLEKLILPSCNIKGYIPTYICNLTRLQALDLSNNNLSGSIPSCLCKLNNLISLDLSGNNLTGAIPSCFFEFKSLSYLDLSRNNLQGTVPRIVHLNFTQSATLGLNLSYNNLHGPLPLPPKVIQLFDLSHNKFSGDISVETGVRLSSATYILLSGNELSGSIPSSLFSVNVSTRLSYISFLNPHRSYTFTYVDLSNNKLSGNIPASIGNCSFLYYLNLGGNNLTGHIPNELAQTSGLYSLQLNDNKLNGTPLNSISQLTGLAILNLANNNFEGSIPNAFGSLSALTILSLKSNKFSGTIPEEITQLVGLQILDLSRNYLTGQIPRKLANLTRLRSRPNDTLLLGGDSDDIMLKLVIKGIEIQLEKLYDYSSGIDLSSNILVGSIPAEIGMLKGLSMLNLSHNRLYGIIPVSIQSMKGLDSLDLSFNKLSGHIPRSIASLDSLGYLNLSHNNLSGRIPRGPHFDTLDGDGSAYINNTLLCGLPTENICEGDRNKTDTTTYTGSPNEVEKDDLSNANEKLLLYAIVAVGFGVGFWGLFFVLLLKKQKWWFPYWRFMDVIAEGVASCFLKN